MTHPPSCPAWGGAQLQAWTLGRPSLVSSTPLFSLCLGSRMGRHVHLCIVAREWFCLEPTTQLNKRTPQVSGCGRGTRAGLQELTDRAASEPKAWP